MNTNRDTIVLASASPRRRELLGQIGVSYELLPVEVDENLRPGETATDFVCRVADDKAATAGNRTNKGRCVLAADTIVVIDGKILGKPSDQNEALDMLSLLSGRTHRVLTAITIRRDEQVSSALNESTVRFREIDAAERDAYWLSGEPADKAGAYAIQGLGAVFIEHLKGSYSGVMGLPLYETAALLKEFGIQALDSA